MPRITRQDALKEILAESGIDLEDDGQVLQEDSSGEQSEIAPLAIGAAKLVGGALASHAIGKGVEKMTSKKKPQDSGEASEEIEDPEEDVEEFTESEMMELQELLGTAAKVAGGVLGSKVAGMIPGAGLAMRAVESVKNESRPEDVEGVPLVEDFRRMMDMPSLEERDQSLEEALADLDMLSYVLVLSEMAGVHPTHFVQMSEEELHQIGEALGYRMFNAPLIEQTAKGLVEAKAKLAKIVAQGVKSMAGSKKVKKAVGKVGKGAVKYVKARLEAGTETQKAKARAARRANPPGTQPSPEGRVESLRTAIAQRLEESNQSSHEEPQEERPVRREGFRERLEALDHQRNRSPEIKERDALRESLRRSLHRR